MEEEKESEGEGEGGCEAWLSDELINQGRGVVDWAYMVTRACTQH